MRFDTLQKSAYKIGLDAMEQFMANMSPYSSYDPRWFPTPTLKTAYNSIGMVHLFSSIEQSILAPRGVKMELVKEWL